MTQLINRRAQLGVRDSFPAAIVMEVQIGQNASWSSIDGHSNELILPICLAVFITSLMGVVWVLSSAFHSQSWEPNQPHCIIPHALSGGLPLSLMLSPHFSFLTLGPMLFSMCVTYFTHIFNSEIITSLFEILLASPPQCSLPNFFLARSLSF